MPTRSDTKSYWLLRSFSFTSAKPSCRPRCESRRVVPLRDVEVDDAVFLRRQVIDIDLGRDLDAPVRRPERRRVAMKQVEGERHVLVDEELPEASEEVSRVRIGRAYAARNREAAAVGERVAGEGDIQKRLVSDDGIIALQLIAIERIVPVAAHVGHFEVRVAMIIRGKLVSPSDWEPLAKTWSSVGIGDSGLASPVSPGGGSDGRLR